MHIEFDTCGRIVPWLYWRGGVSGLEYVAMLVDGYTRYVVYGRCFVLCRRDIDRLQKPWKLPPRQ